jgi:hypothetical protein
LIVDCNTEDVGTVLVIVAVKTELVGTVRLIVDCSTDDVGTVLVIVVAPPPADLNSTIQAPIPFG